MKYAAQASRAPGAVAAVCTLCFATAALASPLFETAGDTTGHGGLNARSSAAGAGSAATYFNPALLTRAQRGIELGTSMLWEHMTIDLNARPAGVDVPLGYRGANHSETYVVAGETVVSPAIAPNSMPTQWLEEGCLEPECSPDFAARPRGGDDRGGIRAYQTVGLVLPLFDDHLVFGVHALLPLGDFTTAHSFFVDEREQFFSNSLHPEMYGDRLTATSLAFGVGAPLSDRWSVGVSATVALGNNATAATYVSDSDNQATTLLLSTDVRVGARITPHLGLSWQAHDRVHLSATAHSPQRFDIGTGFSAALPDGNEQFARRSATHNYLPWIASVGTEVLAVEGDRLSMFLTGTLEFDRWSTYVNRQSEVPQQGYEWADTLTPVLGARFAWDAWQVFADSSYRRTPVPEQTGRTNYVDNDRISASGGISRAIDVGSVTLRIGLQARAHALLPASHDKTDPPVNPIAYPRDDRFGASHYAQWVIDEVPDDALDGSSRRGEVLAGREGLQTNNPGYPGYRSSGLLLGGGVTLGIEY